MADEGLERAVLDEALDKADHSTLHLHLVLLLDGVGEDLHAHFRQLRDDLAHCEVRVRPEGPESAVSAGDAEAFGQARAVVVRLGAHALGN